MPRFVNTTDARAAVGAAPTRMSWPPNAEMPAAFELRAFGAVHISW
jgi:hypothetical protein